MAIITRRQLATLGILAQILAHPLAAPPSPACTCATQRSASEERDAADAVFTGVVTRIQRFEKTRQNMNRMSVTQIYVVHFTPQRIWKGARVASIQVESPDPEFDDCGVDFVNGEEYLVYALPPAQQAQQSSQLTTDKCHRTKSVAAAADDLRALGEPR